MKKNGPLPCDLPTTFPSRVMAAVQTMGGA